MQSLRRCLWLRAESGLTGLNDGQEAEDRRADGEQLENRRLNVLLRMCNQQFFETVSGDTEGAVKS